MGYTMEFRAVNQAELAGALHQSPFPRQAPTGGGELTDRQAEALMELLRRQGFLAGSVDHGSGGRSWFLDQFDGDGIIAAALGKQVAAHLMDRPIEGLTTEVFPSIGWLTHAELTAALAALQPVPDAGPAQAELLADVLEALRITAQRGQDLVTSYG